jgi:pimeloyl-ACP methyl ester carboxylesterase
MKALLGAVVAGAPTLWAVRHCRSPAVSGWAPPRLSGDRKGSVYARSGGDGDQAVVLLHGLVSSGDVFGGTFDRLVSSHQVVVPDLLGFGRSIDPTRASFSVGEHLDALDELADRTGLFDRRWTIGAHSMVSTLALHWAKRHHRRVDHVVCWGAPIYRSPEAARTRISGSLMTRLFALDTSWAERACAISCRHRAAAGWLTAAFTPTLPVTVARAAALHTWPAYRDAMRHLVLEADWIRGLRDLDLVGVRVELVWGSGDTVGDHDFAQATTAEAPNSRVTIIPGADHHLPMTHPEICIDQLTAR